MTSASSSHSRPLPSSMEECFPFHLANNPSGDHKEPMDEAMNILGVSASEYFVSSGISQLAMNNGGICAFKLAGRAALYQNTNRPIVDEHSLEPSLAPNAAMFGRFMGTMEVGDPERERKRAAIEAELGTLRFFDGRECEIRRILKEESKKFAHERHETKQLSFLLIARVVSRIPGLLDFHSLSIFELMQQAKHREAVGAFFETASQIISVGRSLDDEPKSRMLPFVQALLRGNINDINAAPQGNLVLNFFAERRLTEDQIANLDVEAGAEIGTTIVATYDTTALSLLWLLTYLSEDQQLYIDMCEVARSSEMAKARLAEMDLYVLEAIRLGGSNPTALWRRTSRDFEFSENGRVIVVPKGTQIWLDRRGANCNALQFPRPEIFSLANIQCLASRQNDSVASLISRGRYEVNSFSMINTHRNPRKCPGRLFSIRLISIVMDELLRGFEIITSGADSSLRRFSVMPQPRESGVTELARRIPACQK